MQDYTSLADPYYVLSCSSGLTPEYSLRNTFLILILDAHLLAFLLVSVANRMVHACFSALLQVTLLALISFGSQALSLPFHFKIREAGLGSLNSFP